MVDPCESLRPIGCRFHVASQILQHVAGQLQNQWLVINNEYPAAAQIGALSSSPKRINHEQTNPGG